MNLSLRGRVDVEGPRFVAQVKHVRRLSLAEIEAVAVEIAALGQQRGKVDVLVLKRRARRGQATPRLLVMTEATWQAMYRAEAIPNMERGEIVEPGATSPALFPLVNANPALVPKIAS